MSQRVDVSALLWGFLSIVAGALMAEGGVMEVLSYWGRGQPIPLVVGSLGACASGLLLVSGVAFWTRRTFGRRTAIVGAGSMIPVHLAGWISGFVGFAGFGLGIAYPVLLLVMLKRRPNLGAPMTAATAGRHVDSASRPGHLNRREACAAG
jgi:hypothetical protein